MTSWIRVIICFGMAMMLIFLVVTGDLNLLINPRFRLLIIFSILLLIILGFVQCLHMKKRDLHPVGFWGYCLILLPIMVYIFVPPQALDASMVDKKGVTLVSSKQVKNNSANESKDRNEPTIEQTAPYQDDYKKMKQADEIVFTEENYADYLSVLELYPTQLKGKKIRIKGFVFRDDPDLKKDQFVLSRFTISCCAADASVVGIVTQFSQTPILKKDQWIEVEGTLSTTKRFGFDAPIIQLQNYRITEKPKDPYIYFAGY